MRRLIFGGAFVMAVAACSTPAWAQVGGGIKAGVNLASLSGFNDGGNSSSERTGLVAGGFLTVGLAPMMAIQPEVLFSMQGSKLHFSESGIATDATTKLDYVQIPVLLRIGNSGRDTASIYGLFGPTFGLLMRADQEGVDVKDELKNTDMGLAVGAGMSLSRLFAEARYTYGLTDLNKVEEPSGANRNRVISIFIGLAF
jgi:Outer membrane protein beta-barrel domain